MRGYGGVGMNETKNCLLLSAITMALSVYIVYFYEGIKVDGLYILLGAMWGAFLMDYIPGIKNKARA